MSSATTTDVRKGLYGVIADYTAVSKVMPETNSLTYRGYAVEDLVENCSFEEVFYLLWHGELPTAQQLAEFNERGRSYRCLDAGLISLIHSLPKEAHPMDVMRTAVSYMGTKDSEYFTTDSEHIRKVGHTLLAQLPMVLAMDIRRRKGLDIIAPDSSKSVAENLLSMVFGTGPESPASNPADVRDFEKSLILYAEHSFNASTFTARVITSTKSDVYSAITGAIGALKGPLHGGANEFVMHTMLDIDDPNKATAWINNALDNKNVVMGFGHRVYKRGDSRVPSMEKSFRELAARHDGEKWVAMYENMRDSMDARTGIKPNLDFPAGPAYHLLGFPVDFFTPLFVIARVAGWTAHIVEQYENNSLIRPLSEYNGEEQREVAPIEKR
ncbi:bifunctional 2-methylcitrate synthase/citrate synthase [Corynebacterium glutamicum]|uniref:bifunctional 2-methylcitrate synthase/citrate synthase n=1 Tax=Corynebacterium glutamicum TaxID=1718 RepID=UPI00058A5A22|nr:bifunctional 2-methylcitrate synthase/citrate synthase [Corynebacterium glutamicum]AJE66687.1 citrate synthase [Corynebacterium glutamicum]OKX91218.1 2-methylcitrate synthase [Corynebacterium glutamicum]TWS35045.1 citrate synthase [Corynebacterium glutamicum]